MVDEADALVRLVRAYSPSGEEAEAVRVFMALASSMGFRAEVDAVGNGIARIGSGPPLVAFLGHIDTVDGEIPVREEKGVVYGRGTCDAKGALVAALLAATNHAGPGEIVVIAAVGEEADSRGAKHLIPRMKPNAAIVGEPSGWEGVTVGYKGNVDLQFTFEGERAHLSSPEPTTVELALASLHRLQAFAADHQEETHFRSVTHKVHSIMTGRMGGREVVKVGVNVRIPPDVKVGDVLAFLDRTDMAAKYKVTDSSNAVEVDRSNDVVRALVGGIQAEGGQPTLRKKSGTSDMNLAVPVWRCPTAAYGPGDAHLDHTDGERLSLEELRVSARVLRHAFEALTMSAT